MICFYYDESRFPQGPLKFFESFPIIRIKLAGKPSNNEQYLNWFPSEYFYRLNAQQYCVAAERSWNEEVMMGGTLIRQHNLIFDIENNRLGIAHSSCSADSNQVKSESQLIQAGQKLGMSWISSDNSNVVCDYNGNIISRNVASPLPPINEPIIVP